VGANRLRAGPRPEHEHYALFLNKKRLICAQVNTLPLCDRAIDLLRCKDYATARGSYHSYHSFSCVQTAAFSTPSWMRVTRWLEAACCFYLFWIQNLAFSTHRATKESNGRYYQLSESLF